MYFVLSYKIPTHPPPDIFAPRTDLSPRFFVFHFQFFIFSTFEVSPFSIAFHQYSHSCTHGVFATKKPASAGQPIWLFNKRMQSGKQQWL